MDELNLDAESVTRNKTYTTKDHLFHLLKIGWSPQSQLIKKFLAENNMSNNDVKEIMTRINELETKECG